MNEAIENFFKSFPLRHQVHQTADGVLFLENHHAQAYADERLEDKKVTVVERPKMASEEAKATSEEVKAKSKKDKP